MNRINDETFVKEQPFKDHVIGIRIKDGEFYFLAWMSAAEKYSIQKARYPEKYLLDREIIIGYGDIVDAILNSETEKEMINLYICNEDGTLVNQEEEQYENAHDCFLSLIKPYERNGSTYTDHDIFALTKEEFWKICDALRDGDYILVLEDAFE